MKTIARHIATLVTNKGVTMQRKARQFVIMKASAIDIKKHVIIIILTRYNNNSRKQ